jgi:hypothetical protein
MGSTDRKLDAIATITVIVISWLINDFSEAVHAIDHLQQIMIMISSAIAIWIECSLSPAH